VKVDVRNVPPSARAAGPERDHDVLVVGAGPAGAHLALRLARAGWSVGLLDQRRFPRPKPCGDFLGPDCLPLLEELGLLEPLEQSGARRIHAMELYGHGRHARGVYGRAGSGPDGRRAEPHGLAIRREVLDEQAVRAAAREPGVALLEGWSASELLCDASGRVLGLAAADPAGERRELRARFTIGADGLASRVARALGVWERLPWLDRFALTARVPRGALAQHSEVHFVPGGYLALAPVDAELATLNLVVDRAALPRGRAALAGFFAEQLGRAEHLAGRVAPPSELEIRTCGPLAARTRRQTFDGAALVGDASGYVDPVTGEGTYFAMRGAALLSECLDRALHAGSTDRAALRPYLAARRREFAHRRALGLLLQRGLRHPRVVAGVLALLAARPRLTDLLVEVTGAGRPPRELLRPALWVDALAPDRAAQRS
jgi:flavin-dependent dehydrogenase